MDLATAVIRNSLTPFEQFHALLLARALIDRADRDQCESLAAALLVQEGTKIQESDPSRADIRSELLRRLERKGHSGRPAPDPIDYPIVEIHPPVSVSYNDDPNERNGDFVITRGHHELNLQETFRMGVYPVTNRLFFQFVKDYGYADDRFWKKSWRRNFYTQDRKTKGPETWNSSESYPPDTDNYPVTGISYLEARAFVRWMQLRYPDPGWTWCIPSEDMWELAARSWLGHAFPWGPNFKFGYCNSTESSLGRPSDVTQFPLGKSAYGCADLAGNVWEFVEPEQRTSNSCVLRGGSFVNNQHEIKSYFRLVEVPVDFRVHDFGVRCAQIRESSLGVAQD
jgi:hypothetical protein